MKFGFRNSIILAFTIAAVATLIASICGVDNLFLAFAIVFVIALLFLLTSTTSTTSTSTSGSNNDKISATDAQYYASCYNTTLDKGAQIAELRKLNGSDSIVTYSDWSEADNIRIQYGLDDTGAGAIIHEQRKLMNQINKENK